MSGETERIGKMTGELSRGDVLRKGALAGGVVLGLGAIESYAGKAEALSSTIKGGDVRILNYLLPFKYLQFSLYHRILSEVTYKGGKLPLTGEQRALTEGLFDVERQHDAAMRSMVEELGGKPIKRGNYAFSFIVPETAFFLANQIEGYAVAAFNYVIPRLKSKKAQELTASIAQTDARHAATMLLESREKPAPSAFDYGVSEQASIIEIEKFTGPVIYKEQGIY